MRIDEIPVPVDSAVVPELSSGGSTIPAGTVVVATFSPVVQKLLIALHDFAGFCWVAVGRDSVSDEDAHAIRLDADTSRLELGVDRPHKVTRVALLSDADLIIAGAGKNATILGWV